MKMGWLLLCAVAVCAQTPEPASKATTPRSAFGVEGSISISSDATLGVDYQKLNREMGAVSAITIVSVTSRLALFRFRFGQDKPCAVDVSANGVQWMRTWDSGGSLPERILMAAPLQSDTTYKYRILCSHTQEQSALYVNFYAPDEITVGSFRTPRDRRF